MPIERDDLGLRIFGHNVKGLQFFSPDRTLRQEIFLQEDNTLNTGPIGGAVAYAPTNYPYLGFGGDTGLTAEVSLYNFYGGNLIKNSPGQIVVDGAEPQWWDDVANATLTDEDSVGEGIEDKHERCFKLVTTADNVYGYQTFTFADEELLDAGKTVVSFSAYVHCATGTKASIAIYGANMGLHESSQVAAGTLTLLKVEGITLHAADTSIQVRLYCDTDTARFEMTMLNVGPKAMPWKARGIKHVAQAGSEQLNLVVGDTAWTSTDCTALSHNLALLVDIWLQIHEATGLPGSLFGAGHSNVIVGVDGNRVWAKISVVAQATSNWAVLATCDSQIIRYNISEADTDNDVSCWMYIIGYWMWE